MVAALTSKLDHRLAARRLARERRHSLRPESGRIPTRNYGAADTPLTSLLENVTTDQIAVDVPVVFGVTIVPDGDPGVIWGIEGDGVKAMIAFGTDGNLVARAGSNDGAPQDDLARLSIAAALLPASRLTRLAWALVPGASVLSLVVWINGRKAGAVRSIDPLPLWGDAGEVNRFASELSDVPTDADIADGDPWAGSIIGPFAYHTFRPSL